MHKLITASASALALVGASTATATPKQTATLSVTRIAPRAATPTSGASGLSDQAPVPAWALGLMGALGAAIAIVVAFDISFGDGTPDSN